MLLYLILIIILLFIFININNIFELFQTSTTEKKTTIPKYITDLWSTNSNNSNNIKKWYYYNNNDNINYNEYAYTFKNCKLNNKNNKNINNNIKKTTINNTFADKCFTDKNLYINCSHNHTDYNPDNQYFKIIKNNDNTYNLKHKNNYCIYDYDSNKIRCDSKNWSRSANFNITNQINNIGWYNLTIKNKPCYIDNNKNNYIICSKKNEPMKLKGIGIDPHDFQFNIIQFETIIYLSPFNNTNSNGWISYKNKKPIIPSKKNNIYSFNLNNDYLVNTQKTYIIKQDYTIASWIYFTNDYNNNHRILIHLYNPSNNHNIYPIAYRSSSFSSSDINHFFNTPNIIKNKWIFIGIRGITNKINKKYHKRDCFYVQSTNNKFNWISSNEFLNKSLENYIIQSIGCQYNNLGYLGEFFYWDKYLHNEQLQNIFHNTKTNYHY